MIILEGLVAFGYIVLIISMAGVLCVGMGISAAVSLGVFFIIRELRHRLTCMELGQNAALVPKKVKAPEVAALALIYIAMMSNIVFNTVQSYF